MTLQEGAAMFSARRRMEGHGSRDHGPAPDDPGAAQTPPSGLARGAAMFAAQNGTEGDRRAARELLDRVQGGPDDQED